jgi:hypothetical protein
MDAQVLVLGTYHMNNPGLDTFNLQVGNLRTVERQAQLLEVTDRLAAFNPTKIALEVSADRPGLVWSALERYTPDWLEEDQDERVQLGLRLAHRLGHKAVYGINILGEFPFGAVQSFAQTNGQSTVIEALFALAKTQMAELQTLERTGTVLQMLRHLNDPRAIEDEMRQLYVSVLAVGDDETHPGVDLNTGWFERNARIVAKLLRVVQDGDRVLVIFGAGHAYWLRELVRLSPGLELVEANAFLHG